MMGKKTKYSLVGVCFLSMMILILSFSGYISNTQNQEVEQNYDSVTIPMSGEIPALSLNELADQSEAIVIGTVKEISPSRWNTPDGKRRGKTVDDIGEFDTMYTDISISVEKYLKGSLNKDEVIVRTEGGEDNYTIVTVDYEPSFKEGEKVLVYLRSDTYPFTKDVGQSHYVVTGYSQGKFSLTDDGIALRPYEEPLKQDELVKAIESGNYSEYNTETDNLRRVPE